MSGLINVVAGAVTGVLTGFGVGGGTLLILYMQNFTDIAQSAAQGINLAYFIPTASTSLVGHIRSGYVEKTFLLASIAGTAVTAATAWLAGIVPQEVARRIFGGFLIIVGINELLRNRKKQ